MVQTNFVTSGLYNQKFRIHGHLAHDVSPENAQHWFVYLLEDIPCGKQIVGSTKNPKKRWRQHKSSCNNAPSTSTGMSKHFTMHGGCPNDLSREKETLSYTLIDYIDVTKEALLKAEHVPGPKCRCQECSRLKDLEDQWIVRMGTFYGESGLNSRDEIQSKTRFNWSNNWLIKLVFRGKAELVKTTIFTCSGGVAIPLLNPSYQQS